MAVATRVMRYLQGAGVVISPLLHRRAGSFCQALRYCERATEDAAVAELLVDARGALLSVVPFGMTTDLEQLGRQLGRQMQRALPGNLGGVFHDCEPGSLPPVAAAYDLPQVVHPQLLSRDSLVVQSGCHTTLLELDPAGIRHLLGRGRILDVAVSAPDNAQQDEPEALSDEEFRSRLSRLYRLPEMPALARELLCLNASTLGIEELSYLIRQAPSLTADILLEAEMESESGMLVPSVEVAIGQVLGLSRARALAVARSLLGSFDMPSRGCLGDSAFWESARRSAALGQALAEELRAPLVEPEMVYLAGLLQHTGWYVLSRIMRPEYTVLARRADIQKLAIPRDLKRLSVVSLGCRIGDPARLGAAQIHNWGLPDAIRQTARYLQDADYQGAFSSHVALLRLSNQLCESLNGQGEGFPRDADLCVPGLSRARVQAVLHREFGWDSDADAAISA